MKKLLAYLLSAMMLLAVGCGEEYDDSLIWEKLNDHEKRISKLEELCKQMNTNITSLQDIIEALQNNDYVTNIAPITEDGKIIGYTITFSKSGSVTIYHGQDGQDGYTPVIGIAKDIDDVYYWTLDGDWLLDKDGNKVKAEGVDGQNGTNGEQGQNGITPKLKIEDGYWYISYNNGTTWEELGKATGEDGANGENGDSMFTNVTYDDNFVYLTLTDGSVIEIPRRTIRNNEIWYSSSDGKAVTPYKIDTFDANIVSNEYKNGRGVITFDSDLTTIGDSAFDGCSNLISVTIPNNVTAIGAGVFSGCESLTSVTIPNCVTSIGDSAFEGCTSLANIIIPSSVQTIKFGAFRDCTSLSSVTISNGVTTIENVAFAGCKAITNITIPDSVTTIGDWVFDGCTSLTTATISNSLISIGNGAFRGCPSLTAFYGSRASSDNRCLIVDGKLVAFASVGLTTYDIPSSVTSIGYYAFSGCHTLEYVNIPNSVTSIDGAMFWGCASLLSVTIPNGVTLNSNSLCYDCPSLTTITFPESIDAFYPSYVYQCPSLTAIYIKATTPPWCGMDKFYGCDSLSKIYVPASSVNAYKNASGWKNHADIIEGYDFSN